MVDRKFKYNSCQQVKHANNEFLFCCCTYWSAVHLIAHARLRPTKTGTNRPIRMQPDIISKEKKIIINCIFDWAIEWKVAQNNMVWFFFLFFFFVFLHKKQFSTLADDLCIYSNNVAKQTSWRHYG